MSLLKNKVFIIAICLVSFIISGLIFSDRIFGVSVQSALNVANGINMNSSKIINLGTPTNSSDAATKSYVDAAVGGGPGSWTCTAVNAGVSSNYTSTVYCPSGYTLITGGCSCPSNHPYWEYPAYQNGWECRTGLDYIRAYAWCCK